MAVRALVALLLCALSGQPARAEGSTCTAPKDWFNGKPVTQPDPAAFPANASNCDYHLWAWQTFLWLMEPDNRSGRLRFETLSGPEVLASVATPDITPGALLPGLKLRNGQSFADQMQAGPDGLLVDQNGRITYYSIHINDQFRRFVAENALDTADAIRTLDPAKPFPVGTLSLKAAWKVMGSGDSPAAFYSRKAVVNPLIMKDGRLVVDPSRTEEVRVALVGLHIAGSVANHPEMIWSTFEHNDNAPDVEENAGRNPEAPVSARNWTFHKARTPHRMCNRDAASGPNYALDEASQTITPSTEVCRLRRPPETKERRENAENIASLNASVQLQIAGIWKNYSEFGATWINSAKSRGGGEPLQPGCDLRPGANGCNIVTGGSPNLFGSVTETFNQETTTGGCFGCHNTLGRQPADPSLAPLPAKNTNISHILADLYFRLQQK